MRSVFAYVRYFLILILPSPDFQTLTIHPGFNPKWMEEMSSDGILV